MKDEMVVDEIDKKLLSLLQSNSRISLTTLSNELKLTRNAIKYRIKKLENHNYILTYTTIINPKKFDRKVMAILNFNLPLDQVIRFAGYLKKFENITNIYFTTGHYSIQTIGFFENHDALNKFLLDDLSKMPIRDYTVTTVLEQFKEQIFELK